MTSTARSLVLDAVRAPAPGGGAATALIAGSASRHLAAAVAVDLRRRFAECTIERFPDGEVSVQLDEPVRAREVILLAATSPPVNDHLVELLALADACRRADADRIVAIVPYFGYARSDRRDGRRTPIMASLAADLIERAGVDHVVTIDAHTPALEGFFRIPVDNLTAVPTLAEPLVELLGATTAAESVVVAPDLGAVRLATRYATRLDLPVAVCHKRRLGGAEVSVARITGDVASRRCIIVDDMISTGGTIAESVRILKEAGALSDIVAVATHAVLSPGSLERMASAGVATLVLSDTIAPPAGGAIAEAAGGAAGGLRPRIVSIAPLVATAIRHIMEGGSLRELA